MSGRSRSSSERISRTVSHAQTVRARQHRRQIGLEGDEVHARQQTLIPGRILTEVVRDEHHVYELLVQRIVQAFDQPTRVARHAADSVVLSWSTVSGRTYRLACRTDLESHSWTNTCAEVTAKGSSVSCRLTTVTNAGPRFYRVWQVP